MAEQKLVPLGHIPWTDCFDYQCRDKMDSAHIAELRELIEESDELQQQNEKELRLDLFPPLEVFTKGGISDLHYLADGFHRYEALMQAGREAYLCNVHVVEDPVQAAREHSLKANTTHGLKRDAATCQRVFTKARAMFPDIPMYGPDGIEGKTGLSRGFLYRQLNRLKAAGTPDSHVPKPLPKTNPNTPAPVSDRSRLDRVDDKTNPNYEPEPDLRSEPETEVLEPATGRSARSVDGLKREIPTGLRKKDNRPKVADLLRRLGMITSEVDALCGTDGWEYLDAANVGRTIKTAQNGIKAAEFYTECPRCDMDKACKLCKGCGFITSLQHARLDDKDKAQLNQ